MGTFDSFNEASLLVKQVESLTFSLIGSPEEIAFDKEWINSEKLKANIDKHGNSEYARLLSNRLLGDK